MKTMYKIAILLFHFSFFTFYSFSQDITTDTTRANEYYTKAINFKKAYELDSASFYLDKAQPLYIKHLGETHLKNANCYHLKGLVFYYAGMYDDALYQWQKALGIRLELMGKKHRHVADSYSNIGLVYWYKSEYDLALEYYQKALGIYIELHGEKNIEVASSYNNIGVVYADKSENDKALEYYQKALGIRLELLGEKHTHLAMSYNNIGNVYDDKLEYDLALEYYQKALGIRLELLGEKHTDVADSYNNIGVFYHKKSEYDLALEYYQKALGIYRELLGEKHSLMAISYNNIGMVYNDKSDYDLALEYYQKALNIDTELLGKKHSAVAMSYSNIGLVCLYKLQYDLALKYHQKALGIFLELLGDKHPHIASSYNNIGIIYDEKSECDSALESYQKGMASSLYHFNDTTNILSVPQIKDYIDWNYLLQALQSKAQIFANDTIVLEGFEVSKGMKERNKLALRHYQACDTLINQVRKEISMLSDKIALGEKANQVYNEATQVCISLSETSKKDSAEYYKQLAFEFSEKNKSSVLLESLAGAEAMKFAGIPDSLLEKEHDLQIDIALYKRLLSEQPDSAQEDNFRSKLFNANRSYDSLMLVFEIEYPAYHQLKYGQSLANVEELQQILDKNTAIISYQESDSVLTVFYITQKDFEIYTNAKHKNFHDWIDLMRANLSTPYGDGEILIKSAYKLYGQLFPFEIGKKITNLIIIPDGAMSLLPFETLLTTVYQGEKDNFKALPYLVSKYNISYSYSANLFYRTFPKQQSKEVEVTPLNDWLALAPVFDDSKTGGATFRTREMLRDMEDMMSDSTKLRGMLLNGDYITPLPGTESEVKTIYNQFENNNKKALAQLHGNANETFVKSGELENYRYLHFASHGIVNTEKPELSGIILAQDSTSSEDGILYTGEIYNLKLHADLTVLSACETGLGEIKKGEGLIGLTRALLYAGSKNIIVSLWKVADNSTSQLMVDFYKELLQKEDTKEYAQALRQAKLKMISEGKYSHPFYWSPFILVGK